MLSLPSVDKILELDPNSVSQVSASKPAAMYLCWNGFYLFAYNHPFCCEPTYSFLKCWWSGHQSVLKLYWLVYLQLSPTQKSCLQEAHPGINYYHLSHCYTMMSLTVHDNLNSVLAQLADLSLLSFSISLSWDLL